MWIKGDLHRKRDAWAKVQVRPADARAAYENALAKLDPKSAYRNFVQVKHDAIAEAPKVAEANAPAQAAAPKSTPATVASEAAPGKAAGAGK